MFWERRRRSFSPKKARDDKVPEGIVSVPHHLEGPVEEGGQDHEVDADVIHGCGQDLLGCVLVHEQKIPLLQDDLLAVHEVGCLPGAHVDELHEAVGVSWKVHKPRVGPDVDELSVCQNPRGVDLIRGPSRGIVERPVHGLLPRKNRLFFVCHNGQFLQERCVHSLPPLFRGRARNPCRNSASFPSFVIIARRDPPLQERTLFCAGEDLCKSLPLQ